MNFRKLLLSTIAIMSLGTSAKDQGMVIHEWGTFTSFMGSDGTFQEGLHHEDEPLPHFVHGLKKQGTVFNFPNQGCRSFKIPCDVMNRLRDANNYSESLSHSPISTGITQKMETPVIYFYGEAREKVDVKIDFPKGIISQYYPNATSYTPKVDEIDGIGPSSFLFKVELFGKEENVFYPYTPPSSIYSHARKVSANPIKVGNEVEKFIFYRGVGDFETNFHVSSPIGDELKLTNLSKEVVPFAIVMNSDGNFGSYKIVKGIKTSKGLTLPSKGEGANGVIPQQTYVKEVKTHLARALTATGLYEDESQSMVNTWEHSYFTTPGARVLYIVPRGETERILPMELNPAPKELIRTLVGRVEVMTKKEESDLLNLALNTPENLKEIFGRFYEPKIRRLLSIIGESSSTPSEKMLDLKERLARILEN